MAPGKRERLFLSSPNRSGVPAAAGMLSIPSLQIPRLFSIVPDYVEAVKGGVWRWWRIKGLRRGIFGRVRA
jgi:hypothetical protein